MPGHDDCPVCGLPRSLNRKLVWTTDGGIYFQSKRSERLIFLDEEDIRALLEEGVKLRGEQLLDTLRERRRAFTREEVTSQVRGLRRLLLRHWPLAKRVVRSSFQEAAFFGCGNIEISKMKPGKELVVKARHPYHPHLMAGDIWGFWEGLFGVEALLSLTAASEHEWDITVRKVGRRRRSPGSRQPEGYKRTPRRPKRDYGLEVCEKCRLPEFPWELRWDTELGTIYETGTHRHMVITSAPGWQQVIDEVKGSKEGALPTAIGEALAAKAAAEYHQLKGDNYKTAYRHFYMSLPFLGWGKPRQVSRKPFLIEAELEGVPFPQLLAWKMAGVFEALEREPADIKHLKVDDTAWKFLIGPRIEGTFLEIGRMVPEEGRFILPY
ncbi:MAG: hypothetical protein C4536_11730 [Actinobacteria bacterium]|jgi:hypothetical protein|nr:MAG: hypothetical protein C4536_11730 [Actinomycetota bacterium]